MSYTKYTYMSVDEVMVEARKFSNIQQIRSECLSLSNRAHKLGIWSDIKNLLKRPAAHNKLSDSYIRAVANKYGFITDFNEGCNGVFQVARNRGILDEITAHMKPGREFPLERPSNIIYLWEVEEYPGIYKFGVTSEHRKLDRIRGVSRSNNISFNIVRYKKVNRPYKTEKLISAIGVNPNLFNSDGFTEFRAFSESELLKVLDIIDGEI